MFDWFENVINTICGFIDTLSVEVDTLSSEVYKSIVKLQNLEQQIIDLIEYAKIYIIASGCAIAIVIIIEIILISKLNAQHKQLVEIRQLLQPNAPPVINTPTEE